jgi:hypothetical protein
MDTCEYLVMQMESTAEWRREKAEEFPDDSRNLDAAEMLERFAKEITAGVGDPSAYARATRLHTVEDDNANYRMVEWVNEELRLIGFHSWPDNGAAFLASYCDHLEEYLRDQADDDEANEDEPLPEAELKAAAIEFIQAGGTLEQWGAIYDQAAKDSK